MKNNRLNEYPLKKKNHRQTFSRVSWLVSLFSYVIPILERQLHHMWFKNKQIS